jgi:hypothetical protein
MLPSLPDARRAGVAATTGLLLLLLMLLLRPGRCLAAPAVQGQIRAALHYAVIADISFLRGCASKEYAPRGHPVLRHASLVGGTAGASTCKDIIMHHSLELPESTSFVVADTSNAAPKRDRSISARIAGAETDRRPALQVFHLQWVQQ